MTRYLLLPFLFLMAVTVHAADPAKISQGETDAFQQRLYDAVTTHLNQLCSEDGKVVGLKGKSAEGQTALAYYLLFERSNTSRYKPAAINLADEVLREMKATQRGVLPIKDKETPDGKQILGGGPPAMGEYLAALAYIFSRQEGREADLKYLGTVMDQFAWNENGWWAADVDVHTGQPKAPLAKPSPINKNASLVLAAGALGEYLRKIDPELAMRLKAKADKCLYQKILPAQEGDGFWHYSLVGKDPGNKDILGYFMLTCQFFAELQLITDSYHDRRLSAALENAGAFALKHILPMTGPNQEKPASGHSTRATPTHYDLAVEPKRGFDLGVLLAASRHEAACRQVIDATLPHFLIGNGGQDGGHAALPSALILQILP